MALSDIDFTLLEDLLFCLTKGNETIKSKRITVSTCIYIDKDETYHLLKAHSNTVRMITASMRIKYLQLLSIIDCFDVAAVPLCNGSTALSLCFPSKKNRSFVSANSWSSPYRFLARKGLTIPC